MIKSRVMRVAMIGSLAAALFGAAARAEEPSANDPLESVNRATSEFNAFFRKALLDPLVDGYRKVTPDDFQQAIGNIFSNLSEPVTAGSSLLQGDADNAATATKRFLLNSTVGMGGVGDPATEQGWRQRKEDLGQAMGASGVAPGPHIVLPIFGPSNLRDATGDVALGLLNPAPLAVKAAGAGVGYADKKDAITTLEAGALDRYAAEREAYEQHRRYQVDNGRGPATAFPDIDGDKETVADRVSPPAR